MIEYLKVRTAPRDRNLLLRTDAIVEVVGIDLTNGQRFKVIVEELRDE